MALCVRYKKRSVFSEMSFIQPLVHRLALASSSCIREQVNLAKVADTVGRDRVQLTISKNQVVVRGQRQGA